MDFEDTIDDIVEKGVHPLNVALYVVEQYLLEDGVAGKDEYQDKLGVGWHALIDAWKIKNGRS